MHKPFEHLSAAEASRALYIDFEGGKNEPPVLLGILRRRGKGAEPNVHQVVVDADFAMTNRSSSLASRPDTPTPSASPSGG